MSYPVFPLVPELPLKESLTWLTDVMEAWDGTEQRVMIREVPRREYELGFLFRRWDKALVDSALFGSIYHETTGVPDRLKWTLPIWSDMHVLTTQKIIGSTLFYLSTVGYDYHAGGLAVFIRRQAAREFDRYKGLRLEDWEVVTVYAVTSTFVQIASPGTTKQWKIDDLFLPARAAWLTGPLQCQDQSSGAKAYRATGRFQCPIEV